MDDGIFDLRQTYLHLVGAGDARPVPITPDFWEEVAEGQHPELDEGRLVAIYTFDRDWDTWEMHPAGEEAVYVLSGKVILVLGDGPHSQRLELGPEHGAVVPRGVWHRFVVLRAAQVLHITPGGGTQHRQFEE